MRCHNGYKQRYPQILWMTDRAWSPARRRVRLTTIPGGAPHVLRMTEGTGRRGVG
jgi:hypothetical protein